MNTARSTVNTLIKMPFPRGDFSFIQDNSTRIFLQEAWNAIEKVNAWDDLKRDDVPGEGGFMFSGHPVVKKISDAMDDSLGHSGATFGWTMRQMEFIAKDGWDEYVTKVLQRRADDNKVLREDNTRHLKRINSLENKIFTLEDEIRSLRAKLAQQPLS